MADETNGNARLARIESDVSYLRRDLDEWKHEFRGQLESIRSHLSRVVWILIAAVIAAVLSNIGLGG